jgi:hypothetical protein
VWGAVVVVLATTGPARAFYWQNWPGSGVPVQQSLLAPPTATTPGTLPTGHFPPQSPTDSRQPGTASAPPLPADQPPAAGTPIATPEPASGVLGLLGLGALAAAKRRRAG